MDNCSPPSLRYGEALKITTTPSDVGYFGVDPGRIELPPPRMSRKTRSASDYVFRDPVENERGLRTGVEATGFEPVTSAVQERRSTTELRPPIGIMPPCAPCSRDPRRIYSLRSLFYGTNRVHYHYAMGPRNLPSSDARSCKFQRLAEAQSA